MAEPRDIDTQHSKVEDKASTSSDAKHPDVADDHSDRGAVPQGGKGTPSQAEGDRDDE